MLAFLCVAPTVVFAQGTEFYRTLLTRGITNVNAGNNEVAVRELRIAAFGVIESVELFETAQIYLAIASDRLKREADARTAAQRVIAAERVERRYASLQLPAEIREAFEQVARKLLTTDQQAVLRGEAPTTPAPVTPAPTNPSPTTPDPIAPTPTPTNPAITPTPVTPVPDPLPEPPLRVAPFPPVPAPIPPNPNWRPEPTPAAATPTPTTPAPTTTPTPTTPAPARTIDDLFREGDAALARNDVASARIAYGQILEQGTLERPTLIRLAEALYRSREFRGTIQAFDRLGPLGRGEEPYGYYLAVALFETGRFAEAKRVLAAALPFIAVTPDVERYRVRIEGAAN